MSFEPQKFFIGLVDFFSILMPGALLIYFTRDWVILMLHNQVNFTGDSTEAWVVFLFASYIVGHFVFLFGSVLDEWIYDPLRKCTYWGQFNRLADGKKLSNSLFRWLVSAQIYLMQVSNSKLPKKKSSDPEETLQFKWLTFTLNGEGMVTTSDKIC